MTARTGRYPSCNVPASTVIPLLLISALALAAPIGAQLSAPTPDVAKPIQDNSFLVEEAYNQEAGVVQHISLLQRAGNEWMYTFTQEWPAPGQVHQFSFSIPAKRSGAETGTGDLALNYRYQWMGNGGGAVAAATRLTVLLPTGDEKRGFGAGGVGIGINLPVSVECSRHLVAHSNAGATYTPSSRNAAGQKAARRDYRIGQSLVWLARPRFNILVEAVWEIRETITGQSRMLQQEPFIVNPGVRWGRDFENGAQLVIGAAVPIEVGPGGGERQVIGYLSMEHPFRQAGK